MVNSSRPKFRLLAALVLFLALLGGKGEFRVQAAAGIPRMLNHQGRLYNSSGTALGGAGTEYCFKFSIYDDSAPGGGDNKLWPSGSPTSTAVTVRNGAFSVNIGENGDVLDYDFESSDTAYLNVEIAAKSGATCAPGDGAESYETLSPRQRIVASGYALNSAALRGFTPSQLPAANEIPVLSSGNLTLGGVNPQINATGTNALVLQGGAGTGEIRFFNSSNTLSSVGALTLQGAVTAASLSVSGSGTFGSVSSTALTFTNATGSGNLQAGTLNITGLSSLQGLTFGNATGTGNISGASLSVSGDGVFGSVSSTGLTFTNATGSGNLAAASLLVSGNGVFGSVSSTALSFGNATGTALYLSSSNSIPLRMVQNGTEPFLKLDNGSGLEQFRITADGLVVANGFIARQMQFSDEFLRSFAAVTNDVAGGGTTGLGDSFSWGVGSTNNNHVSVAPATDAVGGALRLGATGGTGRAALLYLSAGAANRNDILQAANRPVIVMKLHPDQVGANNVIYAGMSDAADASVTDPVNGIYFTNGGGTTWTAVAREANVQTSLTCTGQTISTTNDAYFRIQVAGTSSVEFFMDNDTSDGINTASCGTVTSTIPATLMTAMVMNQIRTGGTTPATVQIDFIRLNQDDPVLPASPSGSAPDPIAGADVAENIFALDAETLRPGDVLSLLDGRSVTVGKSSSVYDRNLYGVVPTNPGLLLGEGTSSSVRIALAGRVPVRVNLENGPIAAGDWLTSSNEPGVAMKATGPGMVLGRALEPFDGSASSSLVLATVEVREWSGGTLVRTDSLIGTVSAAAEHLASLASSGLRDFARLVADEIISRVAVIERLFVKEVAVLPGGSVSLPAGANESAGHGRILAGRSEVLIPHSGITAGSKIILTPNVPLNYPLAVTEKISGESFTVSLPQPAAADVFFDWVLLRSDDTAPSLAAPPPVAETPSSSETPAPSADPPEATASPPPEESAAETIGPEPVPAEQAPNPEPVTDPEPTAETEVLP